MKEHVTLLSFPFLTMSTQAVVLLVAWWTYLPIPHQSSHMLVKLAPKHLLSFLMIPHIYVLGAFWHFTFLELGNATRIAYENTFSTWKPRSVNWLPSHAPYLIAWLAATSSSSTMEVAINCCFLLPQQTTIPSSKKAKSRVDLHASKSLANSQSIYPTKFDFPCPPKTNPYDLVPSKNLTILI